MPSSSRSEPRHRNGISGSRGGPNPCAFRCDLSPRSRSSWSPAPQRSVFQTVVRRRRPLPWETVTRSARAVGEPSSQSVRDRPHDMDELHVDALRTEIIQRLPPRVTAPSPRTRDDEETADRMAHAATDERSCDGELRAVRPFSHRKTPAMSDGPRTIACRRPQRPRDSDRRGDQMAMPARSVVREDTQAFFLVQDRIYVVAIWRPADYIPGGVPRLPALSLDDAPPSRRSRGPFTEPAIVVRHAFRP